MHAADGDDLAVPRGLPLDERSDGRRRRPYALEVEHVGKGGLDRAPVERTLAQRHADHGPEQAGGLFASHPGGLAQERRNLEIHQTRVGLAGGLGVGALGEAAGPTAAHADISNGEQVEQAVWRRLGVDGQAPLVPVPHDEAGPRAARIPRRRFDLDHVCPEVGQQHGGQRSGNPGAEIDDSDVGQRPDRGRPPAASVIAEPSASGGRLIETVSRSRARQLPSPVAVGSGWKRYSALPWPVSWNTTRTGIPTTTSSGSQSTMLVMTRGPSASST